MRRTNLNWILPRRFRTAVAVGNSVGTVTTNKPWDQIDPRTQAALQEMMRLAAKAIEEGTLLPESDPDEPNWMD